MTAVTSQTDLNKCLREAPLEQMVKAAGEELLTGAKGTLSGGIYYRLVQPVAPLIYTDCKK